MEQKIIWMRYLLIGISTALIFNSCKVDVERRIRVDFLYKNETNRKIEMDYISNQGIVPIQLEPFSSDSITVNADGVSENSDPETCCQGFLSDLQGGAAAEIRVKLDDTLCVFFDNEGPTIISNYESEVLDDSHFKYTYHFTEDVFLQAEKCQ